MPELFALWRKAEELGFDWISIWDHFYPAQVDPAGDCFEGVVCHAALATATSRVRVGSLVYSASYRNPAVLANSAVTIDHISGGRLELGIGGGWHDVEHRAYGIPFEPPGTRLRRMAEAVEVIRLLFTEDVANYEGEFFTLRDAYCNPKPVQRPPRIWIGASGEKTALKLVGRLADGWNVAYTAPEDFKRKLAIVREHEQRPTPIVTGTNVGFVPTEGDVDDELRQRFGDYGPMVKMSAVAGTSAAMVEQIGRYQEAGAEWINLGLRAPFDLGALERFATEVLPQVR